MVVKGKKGKVSEPYLPSWLHYHFTLTVSEVNGDYVRWSKEELDEWNYHNTLLHSVPLYYSPSPFPMLVMNGGDSDDDDSDRCRMKKEVDG